MTPPSIAALGQTNPLAGSVTVGEVQRIKGRRGRMGPDLPPTAKPHLCRYGRNCEVGKPLQAREMSQPFHHTGGEIDEGQVARRVD